MKKLTLALVATGLVVSVRAEWTGEPDRYIPYIESTDDGLQYIDTGYTHKLNTRIECEVEVSDVQSSGWAAVFGARKNNWQSNAFCFFAKDGNQNVRYNRTGEETVGGAFPRNQKVALTCVGDTAKWTVVGSDSTNSVTTAGTADDGANTMFIFVANTAGEGGKSTDGSYCAMKLYSFKIYEGEELKHDYCPCVKNGEGCLYDKVTGDYLRNAGTSTFGGEDLPRPLRSIPGSDLAWDLVDGVLTIGGSGAMPDFAKFKTPWNDLRGSITAVEVDEDVTTVGSYAFYECANLTLASLPKVTAIGAWAFSYCAHLASVELPEVLSIGVAAFQGCPLTSVSLSNVTAIGDQAFYDCSQLASVEMPEVLTIGAEAFRVCPLTALSLPKATTVGDDAFIGCSQLALVEMPEVVTIGERAFMGCSLKSLSLPKVESIGYQAFADCSQLHLLMIPQSANVDNKQDWTVDQRYICRVPTGMKYVDEDAQVLGEGQVAVSQSSIQAAGAETVTVADGEITLGVSIPMSEDLTAQPQTWDALDLSGAKVGLSADKKRLIIQVPVDAANGFMLIRSGDAAAEADFSRQPLDDPSKLILAQ